MKRQSARRHALACGVFASAWLAATIGGIQIDDAAPRTAEAFAHQKDVEQSSAPHSTPFAATFSMAPLATFAEINERPLFAPDRRPHKMPLPVAAPGTPIVLTGIIILPEGRYAMIHDGGSKTVRVAEGDHIASGTIKRIMPDHVEIALANDRDAIVKLFAPGTPKPGNLRAALPRGSGPEARTQRPAAQSNYPRPGNGGIDNTMPPDDAPPRSG